MLEMNRLNELRELGRMTWDDRVFAWMAEPDEVVNALSGEGFEERRREITRSRRRREPTGGVWQGLDSRTGSVASAVWVNQPGASPAIVFIDIDGEPLEGR